MTAVDPTQPGSADDAERAARLVELRAKLAQVSDPVALLEGVFVHSPVPLQIYRADGTCLLSNPAFRELFGAEPPPGYNVLDDEVADAQGTLGLLHRALAGETVEAPTSWYDPRSPRQVEVPADRRVAVAATLFPLRDRTGAVANVGIVYKDVTAELTAHAGAEDDRAAAEAASRRTTFLARASGLLNQSLDYEETLDRLAHLVVPEMADVCSVVLADGESGFRRVAEAAADPDTHARVHRLRASTMPPGLADPVERVARTGEVLFIPDYLAWVRQRVPPSDEYAQTIAAIAPGGSLIAPLRARGEVIGVITMAFMPVSGRRYGDADVALALDLGERAGLAIANARLHGAQRRAMDRLRILAHVSRAISEVGADVRAVARVFVECLSSDMGDSCAIHLISGDGERLEVLDRQDRRPEAHRMVTALHRAHPVRVADSLMGQVMRSGQSLRMGVVDQTRMRSLVMPEFRPYIDSFPMRSLLIVPIRLGDEALGVITLAHQETAAPFDEDDQQLLEDLAGRFAQALARARENEALQRERQRAEEASRAKDEFLAMLGHELRNPLSPILTALELMRLRQGDASARERAVIERQVNHMVRLVDDLLDVSRVTRGKITLKRQRVELAVVVAQAVEIASPMLEQREHRLTTDVPANGLPLEADVQRLAQVVSNLLTNAAKYTPPGGQIAVRASRQADGRVALSVRDSGVGIDADLLPLVFDQFVQGKRLVDRAEGGLGLGLTIVRSLTELHGGTITARSDGPGQGSEFVVDLPLASEHGAGVDPRPAAAPLGLAASAAIAARADAIRILVVDDNRDAAELMAEVLVSAGYDTAIAYDGPGALSTAAAFRPHLAVLDIGLPVMDGYEVARRLRELPALGDLRLVALTGYGQASDRERAAAAGFDEHLVKPVDVDNVLATLRRLGAPRALS